jgi:hypothetical protein
LCESSGKWKACVLLVDFYSEIDVVRVRSILGNQSVVQQLTCSIPSGVILRVFSRRYAGSLIPAKVSTRKVGEPRGPGICRPHRLSLVCVPRHGALVLGLNVGVLACHGALISVCSSWRGGNNLFDTEKWLFCLNLISLCLTLISRVVIRTLGSLGSRNGPLLRISH